MTGDVRGSGGMTGGACGSSCRRVIGIASSGVGGKCGGARRTAPYLSARPGARRFDGFARTVVFRALLLEARKYVLGTIGGPEHQ